MRRRGVVSQPCLAVSSSTSDMICCSSCPAGCSARFISPVFHRLDVLAGAVSQHTGTMTGQTASDALGFGAYQQAGRPDQRRGGH
jgi:hypothetical protein